MASFLRTELPVVSSNDNKMEPKSKPSPTLQGWSTPLEEDKNSARTPSLVPLESTTDSESNKVSSTNCELIVFMTGKTEKLTRIRADVLEAEIEKKFSEVVKIEQSRNSLKIYCNTQQQKEKLLRGGTVAGIEVDVSEPWGKENRPVRKSGVKKVVCGVPPEYTDAEIQEASGATTAFRIKKRVQGAEVNTSAIILTYKEESDIPEAIYFKFLKFKIRDYIPIPIRCHHCQKFGHRQIHCRQVKRTCSVCAGEHVYTDCPNNDKPKCANCGGAHAAVSSQCKAYNEAKSALAIAVKSKLSYRDALVQIKSSQKLGPSESSLVVQPARQASTTPRTPEIVRRPETKESETQTESNSVKTKSCNTRQTQNEM